MKEKCKLPVFLNAKAKGARTQRLREWLERHKDEYVLYETTSIEDMHQQVGVLLEQEVPVIVGAGGDGTLSLLARDLLGTKTALGIIPAGTMNVFASEMGIPLSGFDAAHKVLCQGRVREVDMFSANGIPFLQMCGAGFDARVIQETTWEQKVKWGPLSYVINALRLLWKPSIPLVFIDDKGERHTANFVLLGNGALYGGRLKLFPKAVFNDGLLDVLLFKNVTTEIFWQLSRAAIFNRIVPNSPHIKYLQVPFCRLESSEEVAFQLDGDYVGTTPLSLSLFPHKLCVIAPAS